MAADSLADEYVPAMDRVVDLVGQLDPDQPVPATPGWSVAALVAHVTGVAEDVATGNTDAYAQSGWTEAQVKRRADRPLAGVIDDWQTFVPEFVSVVRDPETHGLHEMYRSAPVVDLLIHEGDLARVAGHADAAALDGLRALWPYRLSALELQLQMADVPPIAIETDGQQWTVGDGDPEVVVRGEFEDLVRSLFGRRTRDQVRSFDWTGSPEPYLDHWPGWVFSWPATEIET